MIALRARPDRSHEPLLLEKKPRGGVSARIVVIQNDNWSPMGGTRDAVVLVENALADGTALIIHNHWGPDRGANADFIKGDFSSLPTLAKGFLKPKVFDAAKRFAEGKWFFTSYLGQNVWDATNPFEKERHAA